MWVLTAKSYRQHRQKRTWTMNVFASDHCDLQSSRKHVSQPMTVSETESGGLDETDFIGTKLDCGLGHDLDDVESIS